MGGLDRMDFGGLGDYKLIFFMRFGFEVEVGWLLGLV